MSNRATLVLITVGLLVATASAAAAQGKGPKKYAVTNDRALVVTREVLVRQGYDGVRIEDAGYPRRPVPSWPRGLRQRLISGDPMLLLGLPGALRVWEAAWAPPGSTAARIRSRASSSPWASLGESRSERTRASTWWRNAASWFAAGVVPSRASCCSAARRMAHSAFPLPRSRAPDDASASTRGISSPSIACWAVSTTMVAWPAPDPPSSSVTVTVTVYEPATRYEWLSANSLPVSVSG